MGMISSKVNSFAVVIPARLESTRIPGKVLKIIDGMTMIEQVVKRALLSVEIEDIYVATDSQDVIKHVTSLGIKTIPTSTNHNNGTSRVAEAAMQLHHDYIVIVQADEILLVPEQLEQLISIIQSTSSNKIYNIVTDLEKNDLEDTSVVKSILGINSQIIFFTRKNPLINRTPDMFTFIKKNTGIFAYPREELIKTSTYLDTPIQKSESIEQLKLLENLVPIFSIQVKHSYPSINEKKDIKKYHKIMNSDIKQKEIFRTIKKQYKVH
jgi:3-deoxy-manno-octulosonate cytidylyltransferase (CMP-KDO synthetase)